MYDVCIVGAGIVGLATAYRLLADDPALGLVVLEKEDRVAAHQSSHNSGVLHAGVYYAPGSRKARLCTQGKAELERFADEHGIPYATNGKVVVAVDRSEFDRFETLQQRATANGVPGLREIGPAELRDLEPHVAGLRALHSPGTGSIDFGEVCRVLAGRIDELGGQVRLSSEVTGVAEVGGTVRIRSTSGDVEARAVLTCGGLQSDRLAAMTGDRGDEGIVPFRGSWLRLRTTSPVTVHGHVYPVPDPRFPFLGVHASRRVDGEVWIGPNAVLSLSREGYDGGVDGRDLRQTLGHPGFRRFAARNVTTGARELFLDAVTRAYLREVRRYLPSVTVDDVEPGGTGIRAQDLRDDGTMVEDFSFSGSGRAVHVRNAPSPAATASLAIARVLADAVRTRL